MPIKYSETILDEKCYFKYKFYLEDNSYYTVLLDTLKYGFKLFYDDLKSEKESYYDYGTELTYSKDGMSKFDMLLDEFNRVIYGKEFAKEIMLVSQMVRERNFRMSSDIYDLVKIDFIVDEKNRLIKELDKFKHHSQRRLSYNNELRRRLKSLVDNKLTNEEYLEIIKYK